MTGSKNVNCVVCQICFPVLWTQVVSYSSASPLCWASGAEMCKEQQCLCEGAAPTSTANLPLNPAPCHKPGVHLKL